MAKNKKIKEIEIFLLIVDLSSKFPFNQIKTNLKQKRSLDGENIRSHHQYKQTDKHTDREGLARTTFPPFLIDLKSN